MSAAKAVVVTGATGFIGRAVCRLLAEHGWSIVVTSRDPERAKRALPDASGWIGYTGYDLDQAVAACGRVIRLSGANALDHRWTRSYKATMWASRVDEARRIARALSACHVPERVLVSAGGINLHAASANDPVCEESPTKSDWVSRMLAAKEAASGAASASGARVVEMRIGIAIGPGGGPLAFIDRPFRLGAGGHIGDGRQYVPWLHVDDMAAMFVAALEDPAWRGPFIAAAPDPVPARDFAAAIGRQLGRKSWLHMPAPVARLILGEVATLVLSSYRADPGKALRLGFRFRHPELGAALASIYGDRPTRARSASRQPAAAHPR